MKFVIATGGSGGHLFPALRVAKELKKEGHEILFFGSFKHSLEQMIIESFTYKDHGAKGFTLGFHWKCVQSIITMNKAMVKSLTFLKKYKPDRVIGFGGYGAFPVVFSAIILRVPAIIHEQNVIPGRANALLAKFVKKIAISFEKSRKYFSVDKTILTGCPGHFPKISNNRLLILEKFNLKEDNSTILVLGGSQGSQHINGVFINALRKIKDQCDVQIIHVSGKGDYQKILDEYHRLGIPFALFEFLDKMEEAYSIADLVISRAGAVTVSEIANFHLPAILIPYPHANGHQKENAVALCETKTSQLIEDRDLSGEKLADIILKKLKHPLNEEKKEENFKDLCFPNAALKIAQEAEKLS